ncbi:MAG: bifunctional hydroxymethylpyrimidine kinase/phosphomethylpyrimidine kinase [Firmicutes bacterium]|nr:bifunctional hydroxymethylpyrimidine kinase/phosphomethylpyrimidine kinase [Bacillota bacterium]
MAVRRPGRALTVAGSDSGGGAGIQADLKTFAAYRVYGMSVITGITAQNTLGVQAVEAVSPDMVEAQLDSVLSDIGADAVKTGMLANTAIVRAVAGRLAAHGPLRLVVDPVMMSKSGDPLLDDGAVAALTELLLPVAECITPNVPEAERLLGAPIRTISDMEAAARELADRGPAVVVVKGGHRTLTGPVPRGAVRIGVPAGARGVDPRRRAVDVVWEDGKLWYMDGPLFISRHTHGTGCTFAAAIAAGLARGWTRRRAVIEAKHFVTRAIAAAPRLGRGHGPTGHWVVPPALTRRLADATPADRGEVSDGAGS